MKRILLTQPLPDVVIEPLKDRFEIVVARDPSDMDIRNYIDGFDGLLVRTGTKLSRETIYAAKTLKVIGRTGVGVDNVNVEAATERGIPLCYTPEANNISVAEHTMAFLLTISKDILNLHQETKSGNWSIRDRTRAVELYGKKIGLLGFGRIGQAVAKMSAVFGLQVCIYDPFINKEHLPKEFEYYSDLIQFVASVDILSIHAPLNAQTKGIVNYAVLKAMKKDAIIINTSRGSVILEQDLEKALEEGWFLGVGLDVFANEPLSAESGFNKFQRVHMTPHSSALTRECRTRMASHAMEGIVDVLEGRKPKWVFNNQVFN